MQPKYMNYIDGKWLESASGETYASYNPADLESLTGVFQQSSVDDARVAVEAAAAAYVDWAALGVFKRAEYLKRVLTLLGDQLEVVAETITAENGKTIAEARGEVVSALKEMDYQIDEGLRTMGKVMPSMQPDVMAYQVRRPLGPVGVITPWNFPLNVPVRKMTPALVSGNTCVLKPAMLTSATACELMKIFDEAGLPPGVVNMITGSGRVAGGELTRQEAIRAITFTGSTEVGRAIHSAAAATMQRTQLEMGGKNPLVVLADADLDAAADAAVLAAFACAGQWCISTSRAIVEKSVLSVFTEKVVERTKKIVVGRGDDPRSTMGPVCGEAQLQSVLDGIERGCREGAELLAGGHRLAGALEKGCFVEPTVFGDVRSDMHIAQEEIFGPVLAIISAADFAQAIQIANNVRYGLGASIFTRDLARAMQFVDKIDAGLAHVNMHTAYKEPQLSFGGVRDSGHGIPEAGSSGIEFFTEHKTVYINPPSN